MSPAESIRAAESSGINFDFVKIQETTTSSLKTEKYADWSFDLKTWTIVDSYKSEEMKLLNEEFLALTKFQTNNVNFEFLFFEKEDENDSLSIEEILPEITSDVVVFENETDFILLPNLNKCLKLVKKTNTIFFL